MSKLSTEYQEGQEVFLNYLSGKQSSARLVSKLPKCIETVIEQSDKDFEFVYLLPHPYTEKVKPYRHDFWSFPLYAKYINQWLSFDSKFIHHEKAIALFVVHLISCNLLVKINPIDPNLSLTTEAVFEDLREHYRSISQWLYEKNKSVTNQTNSIAESKELAEQKKVQLLEAKRYVFRQGLSNIYSNKEINSVIDKFPLLTRENDTSTIISFMREYEKSQELIIPPRKLKAGVAIS